MKELVQLWLERSEYGVAILKSIQRHNTTQFHYQNANDRFAQLLGQPGHVFTTANPVLPLPFLAAEGLAELLLTTLQTGQPFHDQFYQTTDRRWLSVTIARVNRHQLALLLTESNQNTITNGQQPEINHSNPSQQIDLIDSKQLLQTVVDASPVGLALLRPIYENGTIIDFRYLLSNPQNTLITGISQQSMLENSLLSLFPTLLTNGIFRKFTEVMENNKTQHFEMQDEIRTGNRWGNFSLRRLGEDMLLTVQDITRLKQIEAELRNVNIALEQKVFERTAELYQVSALQKAILMYAGLGIVIADPEGIIQVVNPAMEKLSGYQAAEVIGKETPRFYRDLLTLSKQVDQLRPFIDDQSLTDDQTIMAYINRYKVLQRENTLLTKTGQKIPVYSTASGIYDDQNELLGYVDISTDISRLKQVEETLLREKRRIRLAIKAGKLGIWEWDLATNTLTLDDQFYTYFSLLEQNCLQHINDILLLTHPDDLPLINRTIQSVNEGKNSIELTFRVVLPNSKTTHYIKVNGVRYQSECGLVQYITGVAIDQTSLRQAEFALQQSETQYRLLVDSVKEVIFQTDTTGHWLFLNKSWEEITGFTVDESLGNQFLDYVLPDDRARHLALYESLISRQENNAKQEVRYIHKAGGYRWIEAIVQVAVNENNEMTGITGTLTDITDRKLATAKHWPKRCVKSRP